MRPLVPLLFPLKQVYCPLSQSGLVAIQPKHLSSPQGNSQVDGPLTLYSPGRPSHCIVFLTQSTTPPVDNPSSRALIGSGGDKAMPAAMRSNATAVVLFATI